MNNTTNTCTDPLKIDIVKSLYDIDSFSIDKDKFIKEFLNSSVNQHKYASNSENFYTDVLHTIDELISEYCITTISNIDIKDDNVTFSSSDNIKLLDSKCLARGYLTSEDLSTKIVHINNKFKNQIKEIKEDNNIFKKDINIFKENINTTLETTKKKIEEFNSFKIKLIEIMGIFVAIFALIISTSNNLINTKNENFIDIISSFFFTNGIIITSILTLILGINILILEESYEKKTCKRKKLFIFLIPLILFALGILIRHYPKILNM